MSAHSIDKDETRAVEMKVHVKLRKVKKRSRQFVGAAVSRCVGEDKGTVPARLSRSTTTVANRLVAVPFPFLNLGAVSHTAMSTY